MGTASERQEVASVRDDGAFVLRWEREGGDIGGEGEAGRRVGRGAGNLWLWNLAVEMRIVGGKSRFERNWWCGEWAFLLAKLRVRMV